MTHLCFRNLINIFLSFSIECSNRSISRIYYEDFVLTHLISCTHVVHRANLHVDINFLTSSSCTVHYKNIVWMEVKQQEVGFLLVLDLFYPHVKYLQNKNIIRDNITQFLLAKCIIFYYYIFCDVYRYLCLLKCQDRINWFNTR